MTKKCRFFFLPGADHVRLNVVKSIVHCFWEPYFKDIFRIMGFESLCALNTAFGCSDIHKAEQVLAVLLEAGSQTLVKLFLDSCDGTVENPDDFWKFMESSENGNVKLLYKVVFYYITGYFMIKAGVRKCRWDYFLAGKSLVTPLIFSQNHPMYRKLFLYWDFDLAQMPPCMYEHVKDTIGLKVEGKGCEDDPDGGLEHFDFCLENVNKQLKKNLSWAPTDSTWLIACRTHDLVERLTNNFSQYFKISRQV